MSIFILAPSLASVHTALTFKCRLLQLEKATAQYARSTVGNGNKQPAAPWVHHWPAPEQVRWRARPLIVGLLAPKKVRQQGKRSGVVRGEMGWISVELAHSISYPHFPSLTLPLPQAYASKGVGVGSRRATGNQVVYKEVNKIYFYLPLIGHLATFPA